MHQIFKQRRSARQYKQKEVTKEQVRNIVCAAMVSPSGNHVNPWEFVVVKDREQYVRDVLDIPSEYRVLNIMAIGYPLKEPPPHSEEEYDSSKVHEERFSS